MGKTSSLIAVLMSVILAFGSCAPQAFIVSPEMRAPSKSGLNLTGKSMAVVYVVDGIHRDTLFNSCLANGFASRLEEDYYGGEQSIGVFTVPFSEGVDYACKDSMVSLIMQTGRDVVFLVDKPELGQPSAAEPVKVAGGPMPKDSAFIATVKVPFTTTFHVYDSMGKDDEVHGFAGSKEMKPQVYCAQGTSREVLEASVWDCIEEAANVAGYQAANSFVSTWKQERFYVIYYDTFDNSWDKASQYAHSHKWKEAMEKWFTLLSTGNSEMKACACYDIALGCFMMGQPQLALEWLDRSDAQKPVSLSKDLRAKIKEYSGK